MALAAVQVLPSLFAITATYVHIQTQPYFANKDRKKENILVCKYDILMYVPQNQNGNYTKEGQIGRKIVRDKVKILGLNM